VPVEKQVAIIYLGTKGLMNSIPVEKIRDFEAQYLQVLELKHKDVLAELKKGNYTDDITNKLEAVAKEISEGFKN
jgi:F-type H+-transporting ATPase subunit alpha